MGLASWIPSSLKRVADYIEKEMRRLSDDFFEPKLAQHGLSEADIEGMDRSRLQDALDRIDDALQNPEQFGVLPLKIDGEGFKLVPAAPTEEARFTLDAVPTLLSRKQFVLERLSAVTDSAKLSSLRELIEQVSDEQVRADLEGQLDALEDEVDDKKRLRNAAASVATAREQQSHEDAEEVATVLEGERLKLELLERRSAVWRSFLERESAATIIGAVLLVILAISLIAAMFVGTPVPEIVSSAFLLVLGYFFGQTTHELSAKQVPS